MDIEQKTELEKDEVILDQEAAAKEAAPAEETQKSEKPKKEKAPRVNVGAFLKNVNQSLAKIQQSGIPAVSERRETDSQIVLTTTIPK